MGNLQVRFLEGWAPAMAPGYSTKFRTITSHDVRLGELTRVMAAQRVCNRKRAYNSPFRSNAHGRGLLAGRVADLSTAEYCPEWRQDCSPGAQIYAGAGLPGRPARRSGFQR